MAKKKVTLPNVECSDIEILRFLLKVLYEHDCDDLAWRLIERFGSVPNIFDAAYEALRRVEGVTDRVATFFSFIRPLNRQALLRSEPNMAIGSEAAFVRYALVYFMNERNPFDVCLYLDRNGKIINASRLIEENRTREIIGGVSRFGAERLAWMRFYPHEADRSDVKTIERLELLHKLLPAFGSLETEFVDYVEYTPFKFFGLRRALGGDENFTDVQAADDMPYSAEKVTDAKLRDYIDKLIEKLNAQN